MVKCRLLKKEIRDKHLEPAKEKCPDCAVEKGQLHLDGCDRVMCSYCDEQRLFCDCEK